jgi:hypothetical protein
MRNFSEYFNSLTVRKKHSLTNEEAYHAGLYEQKRYIEKLERQIKNLFMVQNDFLQKWRDQSMTRAEWQDKFSSAATVAQSEIEFLKVRSAGFSCEEMK